jgi:sulfate permease, SulP family
MRATSAQNIRADLVAGATVAVVALPLALAFGVTTGAGAAAGLVTAIVAGFVAAVFGSSKFQVSGPTGAMTVVLLPIVAQNGAGSLFQLGLAAGFLIILFGALKLGRFIERIPWSVMEGFTLGIALVIALQQLPLVFELQKSMHAETLVAAFDTVSRAFAGSANLAAVGVVAFTLFVKFGWSWLQKRLALPVQVPPTFVAVLVASAVVFVLNLTVEKVGELPSSELFSFNFETPLLEVPVLLSAATAIAVLGAIESLLAARVADSMAHRRDALAHSHDPNRELLGQGLSNIASAIFGGMPATGAIARTGVNVNSGARSKWAAASHAIFLLLLVLLCGLVVAQIPTAVLAGVLLATSWRIANPASIREAMRTGWADRISYLATAVFVVAVDLIWGLLIGLVVHLILNHRALGEARRHQG